MAPRKKPKRKLKDDEYLCVGGELDGHYVRMDKGYPAEAFRMYVGKLGAYVFAGGAYVWDPEAHATATGRLIK